MNLRERVRNVEIVEHLYDSGVGTRTQRMFYLSEASACKVLAAVAEGMEAAGFWSHDGLGGESALDWVRKWGEP